AARRTEQARRTVDVSRAGPAGERPPLASPGCAVVAEDAIEIRRARAATAARGIAREVVCARRHRRSAIARGRATRSNATVRASELSIAKAGAGARCRAA